jgi:serine/threonine protein phosphatase PrpC
VLFVDDVVYVATVGDSRAIMSENCGKEFVQITNEHKAYVYSEASRILRDRK